MTRATRVGVALAGFLLVVLAASGAWLWWNYRPGPDHWIRVVHQAAAAVLLAVAVVLTVVAILRRARLGRTGMLAGVAVLVSVGGAYVLGRLLPWDRLLLSSFPRQDESLGISLTFGDRVHDVLIGGREVSVSTYRWWAIAHLALSALVVLALVLLWLRTDDKLSRPSQSPAPAEEPAS